MEVSFELLVVAVGALLGLSVIFTAWCAALNVRLNAVRRRLLEHLGEKQPVRRLSDIGR